MSNRLRAPHEEPSDPRRLGLIFAAAHAGCGLRVCGWCGVWLGLGRDLAAGAVSHGVCDPCRARLQAEAEAFLPSAGVLAPVHPAAAGQGAASSARPPVAFSGGQLQPEVCDA